MAPTPILPVTPTHRPICKTLYTLNIDNYAPEICELTYPLLRGYAEKIGADFYVIEDRKFAEWPVVYEKLQIGQLAKERGDEWSIFVDSDALISPEMFDVTNHLNKDTVAHNGRDMAGIRWKYDPYFNRDGRHFGSCNWFAVASDWCLDLWRPLDDLTPHQAFQNIYVTIGEHNSGQCKREHLIDDYTLSRNIARFGLKATTVTDICGSLGWKDPSGRGVNPFVYHMYTITQEEKLSRMVAVLSAPTGVPIIDQRNPEAPPIGVGWGLMSVEEGAELRKKWGVR